MCTIAGYIGTKQAAPILIDMLLREEGFAAGYYSGIATIHKGKIYYAKLTGDTNRLVQLTNAANFPGTVGIIHGRTKSGGGDEWAHPFVGERNSEPYMAYVANGSAGYFKSGRMETIMPIIDDLLSQGYTMHSKEYFPESEYPILSDGTSVHSSDATAQLIMQYIDNGSELSKACEKALTDIPSEDVGIAISLSCPDRIAFARVNRPMMVSFCSHGAYMGSTAMSFPEDAGTPVALPEMTSGYVYSGGFEVHPFEKPVCTVAPITESLRNKVFGLVVDQLSKEKTSFPDIRSIVKRQFDLKKYNAPQHDLLAYEICRSLKNDGLLKMETIRVPGVTDDIDAPQFMMWI